MLFTGCSDGTGPGEPFDPARAEADLVVLGTLFESDQLAAFTELSAYFDLGGGAPLATVSSARALATGGDASPATARRMAMQAADALSLSTTSGSGPSLQSLPAEVLGTTFVFDTIADTYVESDRPGAPASGVRFIVYAIDPISGSPLLNQEVGYADLIDLSPSSQLSAGMRLLLVSGGTTYLDYSFTATPTQSSLELAVQGFLTDGTTRLNFSVNTGVVFDEDQFSIQVDFSFAVPSRQFSTSGSLDATSTDSSSVVETDLTIISGGTKVRFDIAEDESSETINATVYVNNAIFATITGDTNDPVVAGAGGLELTQEEAIALVGMIEVAYACMDFFFDVMEPAGNAMGGGLLP
jgi:hypothetical protein